ncbi:uncharacterized protein METZ01_LOCUS233290 [marine metagenome]|uniref:Uncharacterized protein n=1 Tax=marine metagenome TaxID=408172 RepID=A0A382GZD0_9ZZZZ
MSRSSTHFAINGKFYTNAKVTFSNGTITYAIKMTTVTILINQYQIPLTLPLIFAHQRKSSN